MLYWARLPRRVDEDIAHSVWGLSPAEVDEVRALLTGGIFDSLSDEELLARMWELADS
jgi:hypothetical protein